MDFNKVLCWAHGPGRLWRRPYTAKVRGSNPRGPIPSTLNYHILLENILKSQYKEYLKINKNLLIAAGIDFVISAFVAQQLSELEPYLNTTVTLVADFVTYFSVFIALFLFDNRKKYQSKSKTNWPVVKSDLKKIFSSVGIGEVAYLSSRWFFQFHFLNIGWEAYQASVTAQIIAFVLFMIVTNIFIKLTKLYK